MRLKLLAGAAILLPAASFAADIPFDVKPGLWEVSTTVSTNMAGNPGMPTIPPEKLAQLPPETRARIEAMTKGTPTTNTSKVCMTKEMLAKGAGFAQSNSSCTQKVTSLSASKQEIHFDCTGAFKGSGDGVFERIDSEHAKGSMDIKSADPARPMSMKTTMATKFLSSDCGDVKPITPAK